MNKWENRQMGDQDRHWYRMTGLTTIIMFIFAVIVFLAILPLILGG